MEKENRPWGCFEVLAEDELFKVKKITVKPGARLSYQFHSKRSEVWTIVAGDAIIVLDGIEIRRSVGEVVQIPLSAKHRIMNCGSTDLVFVEVQLGSYFGEDDIIRIEDDYSRK